LLLSSFAIMTESSNSSISCPSGWMAIDTLCYTSFCNALAFDDAERACVAVGGHLAKISTAGQLQARATLVPRSASVWFGLTQQSKFTGRPSPVPPSQNDQLNFKWTDGTQPSPTSGVWHWSDSGSSNMHDCAMIGNSQSPKNADYSYNNAWYDASCCTKLPYLCSAATARAKSIPGKSSAASPVCYITAYTEDACGADVDAAAAIVGLLIICVCCMVGIGSITAAVYCCCCRPQKTPEAQVQMAAIPAQYAVPQGAGVAVGIPEGAPPSYTASEDPPEPALPQHTQVVRRASDPNIQTAASVAARGGWERHRDPQTGSEYEYNTTTRETRWLGRTDHGWEAHVDSQGRRYAFNPATGDTRWE